MSSMGCGGGPFAIASPWSFAPGFRVWVFPWRSRTRVCLWNSQYNDLTQKNKCFVSLSFIYWILMRGPHLDHRMQFSKMIITTMNSINCTRHLKQVFYLQTLSWWLGWFQSHCQTESPWTDLNGEQFSHRGHHLLCCSGHCQLPESPQSYCLSER